MNNKTPKCLWCREAVAVAGTCDPICARLLRVHRAKHPVEPVALVIDYTAQPSADAQYHGDGYRG